MGIAYCAFHNGDYKYVPLPCFTKFRRSMDIYDELMKRNDFDPQIHFFKAACQYALCNYKEAKQECEKCKEDTPLKNRILF